MLTLFHSPQSRSTRIVQLIHEMDIADQVEIRCVSIPRQDGSGHRDPANPHPEGKVPLLVHDGAMIRESNAIITYLTELFPQAGLAPVPGAPGRGAFLGWMAYYGNVVEPVMVFNAVDLAHPALDATFRNKTDLANRLAEALDTQPYLLGSTFSAADLLLASPFAWFPAATPEHAGIKAWVERCNARPARAVAAEYDAEAMANL